VASYDLIKDLPLQVDGHELRGHELELSPDFTRVTTEIALRGGDHEGVGEDVTYDGLDHVAFQAEGGTLDLTGSHTLDSFARRLDELELWPSPPVRDDSRRYRRWAFESAALDLALRQAGRSLAEVLGRDARPLNFVVSMRLTSPGGPGSPETAERLLSILQRFPGTRFKLDPTNTWTDELVDELAATGAVDSLDLKGFYSGTPVDVDTDPELYAMVLEAFPEAWIEDADVTDETRPILKPHASRLTWDAPIHGVADVEARPWRPRMVNIKPSRVGPLAALFGLYDWCEEQGIGAYGGGQTELGVGRGHIQYLASIFHPDTPNDTAPSGYNQSTPLDDLLTSPLEPRIAAAGFRWDA